MTKTEQSHFYDWPRTRSFNAGLTLIVGGRGIGKTYGARLNGLNDFLKREQRTVEIFRTKSEMKRVTAGYFDRLALRPEFRACDFRSDASGGFIKTAGGGKWEKIFYWAWITSYQDLKKQTTVNVRQLIFDEFILDRTNSYQRYVTNEFAKVANIVDTVTRQRAGDGQAPQLFMLANAVDLVNPYFAALGIDRPPQFGYRWYAKKTALLHMVEQSEEDIRKKSEETLSGRLLALAGDDREAASALKNEFTLRGESFIAKRCKVTRPVASIVWRGKEFTIWRRVDNVDKLHIRDGIASECRSWNRVFYFSRADARIDYRAAKRADKSLRWVGEVFANGGITFETPALFEIFAEVATYLGLPL